MHISRAVLVMLAMIALHPSVTECYDQVGNEDQSVEAKDFPGERRHLNKIIANKRGLRSKKERVLKGQVVPKETVTMDKQDKDREEKMA
eukprot:CAMPEP_0195512688 /NCGR_PEP_ID=MMETSP0794_2-20130614/4567_1 /TAXON_ID=515487 /ORGANISM="Stephanopyxis turris, Strain CCMP 815" /LENGTH=88 /DNA_ID=CAMNT_0040640535 /DNA_START=12 /DNA_END=274 /DNA_ORIENTATION=+